MNEKELPIKGYEDSYSITESGLVHSLERTVHISRSHYMKCKRCVMRVWLNEQGDTVVQLSKNSIRKIHRIKDLIKEAFNNEDSESS